MTQERIEFKFEEEKKTEPPQSSSSASTSTKNIQNKNLPISCLVIGMAGSGKTTLMQRINNYVTEKNLSSYFLNLDPAVLETGFEANIDIRETVNYQNVMKSFNLGPNGGILTALNLFSTKFDQVMGFLEKRTSNPDEKLDYVFVDTPGQIEVFTWSSSGTIISESLASAYPTVVMYVIDTPRTTSPITFMSNMLYACSILYKTRLPFILVFNKVDIQPCEFALNWMKDFQMFQTALDGEKSYSSSLAYSLSLVLDEFYQNLITVGVSAVTGQGMDELFDAIRKGKDEYYSTYYIEMERKKKYLEKLSKKNKQKDIERLEADRQQDLQKKGKDLIKKEEEEENDDDDDDNGQ